LHRKIDVAEIFKNLIRYKSENNFVRSKSKLLCRIQAILQKFLTFQLERPMYYNYFDDLNKNLVFVSGYIFKYFIYVFLSMFCSKTFINDFNYNNTLYMLAIWNFIKYIIRLNCIKKSNKIN